MESDTTAIELLDRLAKTWAKWIGPSGDREQYKRMSQFAADGAAALRERDTLRAELAAARERADKAEEEVKTAKIGMTLNAEESTHWGQKYIKSTSERDTLRAELAEARQHAEYQDKEIRQWASVCYVGTWPLSEEDTKNTGFYGRLAAKMTAERNTATARAEKAEAENAALKAHVERLRGAASDYYQRYMLDEAADEEHCVCGKPQHLRARAVGEAILETPAQSLAKLRSDVLIMAAEHCEESEVLMPFPAPGVTLKEHGANVCLALGQELRIKAAALKAEAANA